MTTAVAVKERLEAIHRSPIASVTRPGVKRRHRWTEQDDDVMRREFDRTRKTSDRIAMQLGVTFNAIRNRASFLGLTQRKDPVWSPAELAILRQHAGEIGPRTIQRLYLPHRSKDAINVQMKRLHLFRSVHEGWYTKTGVCELIGFDHRKVQRYIDSGELPATQYDDIKPGQDGGAQWRISARNVRQFIITHAHELSGHNVNVSGLIYLLTEEG